MSTSNEEKCFTYTWEIKNFEVLASWLRTNNSIDSPTFKMDTILQKNCQFFLNLSSFRENFLIKVHSLQKYGIPDRCMMSLLSSDGEYSLEEQQNANDKSFVIQKNDVFGENNESILEDRTLSVRCCIWDKTLESGYFSIDSITHKLKYLWIIKKFDSLKFYNKTFIEKGNFLFYMSLPQEDYYGFQSIIAGGAPIKDSTLSFVDCKWSIKDQGEIELHFKKHNSLRTAWSGVIRIDDSYLGKDLQLELESIYLVYTSSKTAPKFSNSLSNDIWKLYKEQLHTDATLNAADGKSFRAHRSVLAARSPVFSAMFEKDQMSEGRSGVVDIDDVDSETVDRMLIFLYSDSLEYLQWEEAAALFYAADKYAVQPLKKKCADILKDGLTVENACDALVLAELHSENELSASVVEYICDHQEVVSSARWKELEDKNFKLTSEILKTSKSSRNSVPQRKRRNVRFEIFK